MAAPAHHYQSSLEGLIDFSVPLQPLFANAGERARAIARFYRIVSHFEAIETTTSTRCREQKCNRSALIRLTFEYARSPESQDRLLAFFFRALAISMLDDPLDTLDDLGDSLFGIADL